jgi:hypothetical protein
MSDLCFAFFDASLETNIYLVSMKSISVELATCGMGKH